MFIYSEGGGLYDAIQPVTYNPKGTVAWCRDLSERYKMLKAFAEVESVRLHKYIPLSLFCDK